MKISSRNVVEGTARAPHRAMYKAMGLTNEDLSKSFVGVCHTGNEATPCNIHLPNLAQQANRELLREVQLQENLVQLQLVMELQWVMKE